MIYSIKTLTTRHILCLSLLILFLFAGCTDPKHSFKEKEVTLTVSAAASLMDSLNEIKDLYTGQKGYIDIRYNFASSGALRQQIIQGAPVDLFLSADLANMKTLVDKQIVLEKQQSILLQNVLVAITPKDSKIVMTKLEDLAEPLVKVMTIGDPLTVPAGQYTKEALTKAKVWDRIQPKLVLGKDVRQVLTYIETGNADVGFVYQTDALISGKVAQIFTVDPQLHTPILYPVGILKNTGHMDEAQHFYNFLRSPEAMNIFVKYGFSKPEAAR
jgi:molybdate transport system substrate-binding protein